jgi:choline-sulfatase
MRFAFWRGIVAGCCTLGVLAIAGCKSSPKSSNTQTSAQTVPHSIVPPQRVNVVLITLDTVRADHLHCYGYEKIKTPNIDALANSGVLFEKAVTQTPLTGPSHASIFTGLNPNVHHVRDTGGFALQPSSVTLASILQENGWDTTGFISAPVLNKLFGFNQGFSFYDDQTPQAGRSGAVGESLSDRPGNVTVDHAIKWLNGQSDKPFFVWLHLYDAHLPYHPPAEFRKQYPKNLYDAEIAFEDQQLGRFLDAVREKYPQGKTMIVLLSDHGEGLGQHGEAAHGIFLYDSTVRIAWIMSGPGIPAGLRIKQQVREIDVLPTIVNLLGGKPSAVIQGVSVVPAFSGKPISTEYSYEETLYPKINMGWSELRGIHTDHWMYIRAPKPELYDLDHDPGELKNVIGSQPKEFRELEAKLKQLSRLGTDDTETVVTSQMDQHTLDQLRSLGYVGGASDASVQLNGKGADPKDMLPVLRAVDILTGPGSENIPPARAIELNQKALKQDPTNPFLYSNLGDLYQKIGKNDLALAANLDALHHGIHTTRLLTRLGNLYIDSNHLQEAIVMFQQAVKQNPKDAETESNLADAYLSNNQSAEAEQVFREINARHPYPKAYNGLGVIAMRQHDFASARTNLERAIELDPTYPEARYDLGVLCDETHDYVCEKNAFQIFIAHVSPVYQHLMPSAQYHLGTACSQLRDTACARSAYEAFLVNTPSQYQKFEPQVRAALNALP